MNITGVLKTLNFRSFFRAVWWGVLIGAGVGSFSYVVLLGAGTTYASISKPKILKEVKAVEPPKIASTAAVTLETINNRQLSQIIEELDKTKEDLRQTKAALKAVTDNMSEHFINNYRDTINVVGTGIGIVAALLSGLIAWGYGLAKKELSEQIKRESESAYEVMTEKSKNTVAYTICRKLSHAFYRYYRVLLDETGHRGFKPGVELAAWFANGAIVNASRLPAGKEREDLVNVAKLDLQYHKTCMQLLSDSPEEKDAIIKTTLDLYGLQKNNPDSNESMPQQETVAWVLIMLGDREQIKEGKRILKAVLANPGITVSWRSEVMKNYALRQPEVIKWLESEPNASKPL